MIEPWKLELVERQFKEGTAVSRESCPCSQTEVSGSQGHKGTTVLPVVRICRPKRISKLRNPPCEGKDDVTNIVQTTFQDLAPKCPLTSEVPEEFVVERVIDQRIVNGKVQFFLKWKGFTE